MGIFSFLFGGGNSDYGSKQYSSQMGAAATQSTAASDRAFSFAENFFNEYVKPQLQSMADATREGRDQSRKLFDMQFKQAQLQDQRYRKLGIPAEDRFYRMVDEYSAPEEEEEQARAAIADARAAEANQQGQFNRALASRGIDPNSPAAISAMSDRALYGTLIQTQAANKARENAKALGMQLTGEAASFARNGMGNISGFAAGAGNAATAGVGTAAQGVSSINSGGSVPMSGFNTALQGYGQTMNAYGNLTSNAMSAEARENAASSEGTGSFLGALAGFGLKKWGGI